MATRRIKYAEYKQISAIETVKNSYDKETKTIEVTVDDQTAMYLTALSGKLGEVCEEDRKAICGYLTGVYAWDDADIEKIVKIFA